MKTNYSLVMVRYLILVYILGKRRITGSVGPLFRQLSDDQSLLVMAQALWANVKELIIRPRDVLCYNIEPDLILHFIDIIEDTLEKNERGYLQFIQILITYLQFLLLHRFTNNLFPRH